MQICQYEEEVSAHMEFMIKKQNETDQGMSREGSVIQNSSWFSIRGKKRAYETHEIEFIMLIVDYLTIRLENCTALCLIKILRVLLT